MYKNIKMRQNPNSPFFWLRGSGRAAEDQEYEYIQGSDNIFHIHGYSLMFK